MQYRIGSLFSGIGGLEAGIEASGAGVTTWQCEIDAHCRAVLADHWPDAECHVDIEKLEPDQLADVDIICGGFPCQDTSVANARGNVDGTRAGLHGARSGLWSHMERIIAGKAPRWVVVENVAHGQGKWLPGVRAGLERLGYATLPVPLEARYVGAPHQRRRIFLLAHADGIPVREHQQRLPRRRAEGVRDGGHALAVEHGDRAWRQARPELSCLDDGLPRGLAAPYWRAIGNAAVPQCAEILGWMIREIDGF